MDSPSYYEIRIAGELPDHWSSWLAGLAIQALPDGETTLCGFLPDQAALIGVLGKLHNLNITLLSVCSKPSQD